MMLLVYVFKSVSLIMPPHGIIMKKYVRATERDWYKCQSVPKATCDFAVCLMQAIH